MRAARPFEEFGDRVEPILIGVLSSSRFDTGHCGLWVLGLLSIKRIQSKKS